MRAGAQVPNDSGLTPEDMEVIGAAMQVPPISAKHNAQKRTAEAAAPRSKARRRKGAKARPRATQPKARAKAKATAVQPRAAPKAKAAARAAQAGAGVRDEAGLKSDLKNVHSRAYHRGVREKKKELLGEDEEDRELTEEELEQCRAWGQRTAAEAVRLAKEGSASA